MRSDVVKIGTDAAPARSLLRADGLSDEDFEKPFIGIANSWNEVVPGHIHLNRIVDAVKEVSSRREECPSFSVPPPCATVSPWDTRE